MSEPSRGRGRKVMAPRGKGRRSQVERERLLQAERERTRAREAQYAEEMNAQKIAAQRAERIKLRERGGRGRGRGGFMGDSRSPSGPFSAGSIVAPNIKKTFPRPWAPSKRPRPAGPRLESGVKSESTADASQSNAGAASASHADGLEPKDGGYISSDPDEAIEGPRKDVDYINLVSEDEGEGEVEVEGEGDARANININSNNNNNEEDDIDNDNDKENEDDKDDGDDDEDTSRRNRLNHSPVFAPVRVHRTEHRDRAPPVNPEPSIARIKKQEGDDTVMLEDIPVSSVKKGKQRAKEPEVVRSGRPWRGVYQDDDDDDDDDSMAKGDRLGPLPSHTSPSKTAADIRHDRDGPSSPERPRRRRRSTQSKLPAFQTEEDRKEWDRRRNDVETLKEELGYLGIDSKPGQGRGTRVGDTEMAGTDDYSTGLVDKKADRVYLFQFPPVVPDLLKAGSFTTKTERVKDEPISPKLTAHVQPKHAADVTHDPLNDATTDRGSKKSIPIKIDSDDKPTVFPPRPAHLPRLEPGLVGKLRIRKNGKATLDWGGVSLQLNMGTTPHFLQDTVLVRASQRDGDSTTGAAAAVRGEALSFGQARGKFIVTPDWDEVIGGF